MKYQIFELRSDGGKIRFEELEAGNLPDIADWKDFKSRAQSRLDALRQTRVIGQSIVVTTKPYPDGAIVGVEMLEDGLPGRLSLVTRDEFNATWLE